MVKFSVPLSLSKSKVKSKLQKFIGLFVIHVLQEVRRIYKKKIIVSPSLPHQLVDLLKGKTDKIYI